MKGYQVLASTIMATAIALAACSDDDSMEPDDAATEPSPDAGGDGSTMDSPDGQMAQTDSATGDMDDASTGGPDAAEGDSAMGDPEPADYADPANWLCRPGREDACTQDLSATIVAADGSLTEESFAADPDAPVDCFYVYPTVSLDETPNSDLVPGPEEERVVLVQFARFAEACRLFAPMYRQVTLTALRAALGGMATDPAPDRALGYRDVVAAFEHYLEHDNDGRGVVLVGHSQGAGVLSSLVADVFDEPSPDPRLLAAMLIGTTVEVPPDSDVGGTFQNVPLCRADDQLGCVVTYASFRSDVPPPEDSLFGRAEDPDRVAGCTNPAALGGGSAELQAYLSTAGPGSSAAPMPAWVNPEQTIDTSFVKVPGLLSGECVSNEAGTYLSVTVQGDPEDPRVDDIVGDVVTEGEVQETWGLHLIDMHMAIGDLIDLVHAKAEAYAAP